MAKFVNVNYDLQNKSTSSANFPLPGGNNQLEHLIEQIITKSNRTLIFGPISSTIANKLLLRSAELIIISDNYESLMNMKLLINTPDSLNFRMMDFAHTDFKDKYFDLIYTQGSISVPERKNILKEIKRIITDDGILSVGEVVSLKEPVAGFVKDIWEQSGLEPLLSSSLNKFYESRGFEIIGEKDFSDSLKDYYENIRMAVSKASKEKKEEQKKSFYKN